MNRVREITVELGEAQTLELRLDFNAIARIEEATGEPFFSEPTEGGAEAAKNVHRFSAKETRMLVHACAAAFDEARDREPRLTLRKVGTMLSVDQIPKLNAALAELVLGNMPEKREAPPEGGPPRPTPAPAGP